MDKPHRRGSTDDEDMRKAMEKKMKKAVASNSNKQKAHVRRSGKSKG